MRSALLVHRITEDQAAAQARSVWLGLGLLDRAGQRLYDAVLLLDSQGGVALHYRRIQPQWLGGMPIRLTMARAQSCPATKRLGAASRF